MCSSDLPHEWIERLDLMVNTWIEKRSYCHPSLTLSIVAKELGTNQNYLSAFLNKNKGLSFQVWLNSLRIEYAKELMWDYPTESIEKIGLSVGFTTTYNFSRWCKRFTNLSPLKWRKNNIDSSL